MSDCDRRRFESHLDACSDCTEYMLQMRTVIRLTGQLTPEDLSPDVQDRFLRLFREWKSESS
jgi:anti-sigma factor RsiW